MLRGISFFTARLETQTPHRSHYAYLFQCFQCHAVVRILIDKDELLPVWDICAPFSTRPIYMPSTFDLCLAKARDRLGLTQGNISEWTGINRKAQSAHENEQRYPNAGCLMTLFEDGFDVSYMQSGKCAPRNGAAGQQLRRSVFTIIETRISAAELSIDLSRTMRMACTQAPASLSSSASG